ncbi:MAG: hypothetical protein E6Q95_04460 [Chitinophagaceae bacterium]|nr:MAG: hypothetical protein E6Q95_04460 [Chitinophagaceae bacterium]
MQTFVALFVLKFKVEMQLNSVINHFFDALKQNNEQDLLHYLDTNYVYNDPLYGLLYHNDARKRWKLWIQKNKIENIEIIEITEYDHEYAMVHWKSVFYYQPTNKKVTLFIKFYFKIENNLITEKSDAYKLSVFIKEAYGLKGLLFGWIKFMQHRVRKVAIKDLNSFNPS